MQCQTGFVMRTLCTRTTCNIAVSVYGWGETGNYPIRSSMAHVRQRWAVLYILYFVQTSASYTHAMLFPEPKALTHFRLSQIQLQFLRNIKAIKEYVYMFLHVNLLLVCDCDCDCYCYCYSFFYYSVSLFFRQVSLSLSLSWRERPKASPAWHCSWTRMLISLSLAQKHAVGTSSSG